MLAKLNRQLQDGAEWGWLLLPQLGERDGQPFCFLRCLRCGDLLNASNVAEVYEEHKQACHELKWLASICSAGANLATLLYSAEGQLTFSLRLMSSRLQQALASSLGAAPHPQCRYGAGMLDEAYAGATRPAAMRLVCL